MQRIMQVQYKIPDYVHISLECKQLIARIFVPNPAKVMHENFVLNYQVLQTCH
jgi:hypothetical protein